MIRNIIFDLDLTLVDTTALEPYRDSRDWQSAYASISRCSLYPGIREMLDSVNKAGISICIVSTSPRTYVEKIVQYFNIPARHIIGYHDAPATKPSPEPMLRALSLLGCSSREVLSFGDRDIDIKASRSADIISIACLWGAKDSDSLLSASPSFIIETPADVMNLCNAMSGKKYAKPIEKTTDVPSLPMVHPLYRRLKFYKDVKIKSRDAIFACIGENGPWALLNGESYDTKTEYVFDEVGVIDRNNNIWLMKDGLWGVYNIDTMQYVLGPRYHSIEYQQGYTETAINDSKGVVESDREVIPCSYDEVKRIDTWIYIFRKNSKWGMKDTSSDVNTIPCSYDEIKMVGGSYASLRIGSKLAYYYSGRSYLSPLEYEYVDSYYNYVAGTAIVKMSGKYGMVYCGEIVAPCIYDKIEFLYKTEQYFKTCRDGKYGLVLGSGEVILENRYDEVKSNICGEVYYKIDGVEHCYNPVYYVPASLNMPRIERKFEIPTFKSRLDK